MGADPGSAADALVGPGYERVPGAGPRGPAQTMGVCPTRSLYHEPPGPETGSAGTHWVRKSTSGERGNIEESLPASQNFFASAFWFYLPSACQVPGAVPTKT